MKRINSDGPKFHQSQQNEQSSITSNYRTYKKSPQQTTCEIPVLHFCSLEQDVARLNRFMGSKPPSSYLDLQLQYRHTNILV